MPLGIKWRRGNDDLVPFLVLTVPVLLWVEVVVAQPLQFLVLFGAGLGFAFALRRLLPPTLDDLALVPVVAVLLTAVALFPLTIDGLLLAALAGVGLLLWAGSDPTSGVGLRHQLEPALVPALAVGLAVVVMLFLPGGSGGEVGLAALVLVAVLGMTIWLYLRSASEVAAAGTTS